MRILEETCIIIHNNGSGLKSTVTAYSETKKDLLVSVYQGDEVEPDCQIPSDNSIGGDDAISSKTNGGDRASKIAEKASKKELVVHSC